MKSTGIVRRMDNLGRVVIPKEIRRSLKIKEDDPFEIFTDRDGSVIFKPYHRPWEDCVIDWYNNNISLLGARTTSFIQSGDYTICTFWDERRRKYQVGQAKRYESDNYDGRIGEVAAYARAMRIPINDLIGYED